MLPGLPVLIRTQGLLTALALTRKAAPVLGEALIYWLQRDWGATPIPSDRDAVDHRAFLEAFMELETRANALDLDNIDLAQLDTLGEILVNNRLGFVESLGVDVEESGGVAAEGGDVGDSPPHSPRAEDRDRVDFTHGSMDFRRPGCSTARSFFV